MSNFNHPLAQNVDLNGDVYSGAKLSFFEAGGSTPLTVYQDEDLTTAHAVPVVADSSGVFPLIYLPAVKYRVKLEQSDDTLIYDEDNLSPALSLSGDGGFIVGTSDLKGAQPGYFTASTGDSGVSSPSASADDLMAESAGDVGNTLASPNTASASWVAADPENATAFQMKYAHATDTLELLIQSTSVLDATATLISLKKNTAITGAISGDTVAGDMRATQAEAEAATASNKIITPERLPDWAAENLPFTNSFESAEQTISQNGTLTLPHGLGVTPTLVQTFLVCKTAEYGYAVGEVITISNASDKEDGAAAGGNQLKLDATNIVVRYANRSSVYNVMRDDTGFSGSLTNANWRLVVRAWA